MKCLSKNDMNRWCLLLISLCILAGPVRAQVAIATAKELSLLSRGVAQSVRKGNPLYIPGKARVGRTGLYSFQVTRVLERRAAHARKHAVRIRQGFPLGKTTIHGSQPVSNFKWGLSGDLPLSRALEHYTPRQKALYLSALENRIFLKEAYRLRDQVWTPLAENLPRLRQAAAQSPQPADPIAFVIQQLPSQINTLAIGEVHCFVPVRSVMAQLLTQLRQARPTQEIFLFTEALEQEQAHFHPQGKYSVLPKEERSGLDQVWRAARDNHIPVIGLEPQEVLQDAQLSLYARFEHADRATHVITPYYASLTGMKWRNKQFAQTIQKYRAQHPDALFVIHTGGMHVEYTAPFSLTAQMNPAKTFVLRILPTEKQVRAEFPEESLPNIYFMWDPLGSELNGAALFNQPFLYWQDPQLARMTGVDAYLQAEERFWQKP